MLKEYDDLTNVSLEKLSQSQSWQDKYRFLTRWGAQIKEKPELRQPEYLIKGCESAAWIQHEYNNDHHVFIFDSESRVIRGLGALLLSLINSKTDTELASLHFKNLLAEAGLEKRLTPSRSNGFRAIVIRAYELADIPVDL